jgi:hypothetical protein
MTFEDCVKECFMTPDFVKQFNRLTGCKLLEDNRTPIDRMIDSATGYDKEIDAQQREYFRRFLSFVFEFVWLRIIPEINSGGDK